MKNVVKSLFIMMLMLGAFSLAAAQNYEIPEPLVNNQLGVDISGYSMSSKSGGPVITQAITYQYTTDGWLQHVGIYEDSVICTNVAGPREGVQFIIMNNGAILDMCHNYKKHKDYFTNKYSWGEVRTYENYQEVRFK